MPRDGRRSIRSTSWGLAVPWLAVLAGWVGLGSAWAAILLYHALILLHRVVCRGALEPWRPPGRISARALPAAGAGLAAWLVLPRVVGEHGLGDWLAAHGLSGWWILVMAVYFATVHPVLEQMHWRPLRRKGWSAHAAFAGYHAIVLGSLLPAAWVAAIVLGLLGVSWWWGREDTGPAPGTPLATHLLADASLAVAMLLLVR